MSEYQSNPISFQRERNLRIVGICAAILAVGVGFTAMNRDAHARFLQKATTEELLAEAKKSPGDAERDLILGRKLVGDGRYAEAYAVMKQTVKQSPESYPAWRGLAIAAAGCGHASEALEANLKACKLNPGYAEGHATAGTILIQAGLLDEGLEEIDRARKQQEDVRVNVQIWSQALADVGREEEAYDKLIRSLNIDPTQDALYEPLSKLAVKLGKYNDALSMMLGRIKISPMYDMYQVRAPLAMMMLAQNHDPESLGHALYYAEAAAKCGLPKAQVPVARVYLAMNEPHLAKVALEKGLKVSALDPDCLAMLATIEDSTGNHTAASAMRKRLALETPLDAADLEATNKSARAATDPLVKRAAAEKLAAAGRIAQAANLCHQCGAADARRYQELRTQALQKLDQQETDKANTAKATAGK